MEEWGEDRWGDTDEDDWKDDWDDDTKWDTDETTTTTSSASGAVPRRKTRKREYNRHLDSPILSDKLEFYQRYPRKREQRFPNIPQEAFHDIRTGFVHGTNIRTWLQGWVSTYLACPLPDILGKWKSILEATSEVLDIQLEVLSDSLLGGFNPSATALVHKIGTDPDLLAALGHKWGIVKFNQLLDIQAQTGKPEIDLLSSHQVFLHDDLVYFPQFPGTGLVLPYNEVLGVLDTVESKFSYLLYTILADHSPLFSHMDYRGLSTAFYHRLEEMRDLAGNNICHLMKVLEPLAVAAITSEYPTLPSDPDYGEVLTAPQPDIPDLITQFKVEVYQWFKGIIQEHQDTGVRIVLNMYGQEKMHGYPIIHPELGLSKMREEGTSLGNQKAGTGNWLRGIFVKHFIRGYYLKENCFPPVMPSLELNPGIAEILATSTLPSIAKMNKIRNTEWARVCFAKTFTFDYFPNVLDLIDDKAAAPKLSKRNQIYLRDVLDVFGLPPVRDRDTTKLMLYILEQEKIDVEAMFEQINREGRIPEEYSLIELKMKEREEKLGGRPFSVMHPFLRMTAAALERNLSAQVLGYFDTQTMTESGSSLKRRVDSWVRDKAPPGHEWVYCHMDFSNWNYHFREMVTGPTAASLDELFGTQNFKWGPRFFAQSTIVYGSPFNPPVPGQTQYSWQNHLGGNQGICQKFWTILTQLVIKETVEELNISYRLMGSGDNQVLAVCLPVGERMAYLLGSLKRRLQANFSDMNLTLKIEETWHSSVLLAYQRKYHFKGVAIETADKMALRSFFGTSDADTGLTGQISTAMQAGMVMGEATASCLTGPVFALIEAFLALNTHSTLKGHRIYPERDLVGLALIPADLGGFPFLNILNFLYAGHKDTLTETLGLYKKLFEKGGVWKARVCSYLNFELSTDIEANRLRLALNPYTGCVNGPATPDVHIARAVEEELRKPGTVKNTQVRQVLLATATMPKEEVANMLFQIDPVHLSLVKSLFRCTNAGEIVALMNRFTSINSLVNFAKLNRIGSDQDSFSQIVRKCDKRLLYSLLNRIQSFPAIPDEFWTSAVGGHPRQYTEFCAYNNLHLDCSFSVRLFITSYNLGKNPHIVNGPFVPTPLEQIRECPLTPRSDLSHSILVEPDSNLPLTEVEMLTSRGRFNPYFGSGTKDTSAGIKLSSIEHTEVGSQLTMLMSVIAWMRSTGSSPALITALLDRVKDLAPGISPDIDTVRSGARFGCFTHRFQSRGDVVGCYDYTRSIVPTHYRLTTNRCEMFQRGDEDYTVFFQQLFQYILSLLRFSPPIRRVMNFEINTTCCTYKINEIPFQIPEDSDFTLVEETTPMQIQEDKMEEINREINWKVQLQSFRSTQSITGHNLLAGVIAHKLLRPLRRFNVGGRVDTKDNPFDGGPQHEFNVTDLRKVDTIALLKSILVGLAYTEALGRGNTRRALIHHLRAHLARRGTLSRVEPFHALFEALITAGKLDDLVVLARMVVPRSSLQSGIGLLPIFFHALLNVLSHYHHRSPKYSLVVEKHRKDSSYGMLLRFLSRWGNVKTRLQYDAGKGNQWDLLSKWSHNHPFVSVTITADPEVTYERARAVIKTEDAPPQFIMDTLAHQKEGVSQSETCMATTIDWNVCSGDSSNGTLAPEGEDQELIKELTDIWEEGRLHGPPYMSRLYLIARPGVAGSTAHFKLRELLDYYKVTLDQNRVIMALAEGSGSMLSHLLHRFPGSIGVYNSLAKPEEFPHSLSGSPLPTDCICVCRIKQRILNWNMIGLEPSDLRNGETWDTLESHIEDSDTPPGLLTWDMEGDLDGKETAIRHLQVHVSDFPYEHVVVKLFSRELGLFGLELLSYFTGWYRNVSLYKPPSSNPFSTELYVYCTGRFVDFQEPRNIHVPGLASHIMNCHIRRDPETVVHHILVSAFHNHKIKRCGHRSLTVDKGPPESPQNVKEWIVREFHCLIHFIVSENTLDKNTWRITHSLRASVTKGALAVYSESLTSWLALGCYMIVIASRDSVGSDSLLGPASARTLMRLLDRLMLPNGILVERHKRRQFFSALGEFMFSLGSDMEQDLTLVTMAMNHTIQCYPGVLSVDSVVNNTLYSMFQLHAALHEEEKWEAVILAWPLPLLIEVSRLLLSEIGGVFPYPLSMDFPSPLVAEWVSLVPFPIPTTKGAPHKIFWREFLCPQEVHFHQFRMGAVIISAPADVRLTFKTPRKFQSYKVEGKLFHVPDRMLWFFRPPYWAWSKSQESSHLLI